MGSWNAELGTEASSLCPKGISAKAEVGTENLSPQNKHMNDITLVSHRDYMKRMFSGMTIRDAERHQSFIEALYATEAYLVEQARDKQKSPAGAELKPLYIFSIAPQLGAVNN